VFLMSEVPMYCGGTHLLHVQKAHALGPSGGPSDDPHPATPRTSEAALLVQPAFHSQFIQQIFTFTLHSCTPVH